MPTTYAHYRLGTEVLKKVSPEAGKIIREHPDLFNYGVHGPDLLFYYNALSRNRVNEEGSRLHDHPGAYFFQRAADILREKERKLNREDGADPQGSVDSRENGRRKKTEGPELAGEELEAAYSYIYGFLCHFALDVCCHGYVQEIIDSSGITHSEIEAELDREFLVRDGKDPVRQKLTGHLKPSEEGARVISLFYEGIGEAEIHKAMKDMVMYLNLLVLPGRFKRGIILWILKVSGHYESKHGLIINYEKNPDCADGTERLIGLYQKAVDLAAEWIDGFRAVVRGEAGLPEAFRYNFSSKLPGTETVYKADQRG